MYGLFRDLIPTEAVGQEEDLQRGTRRQGLLPDFRLEIPSPLGEPEFRLLLLSRLGTQGVGSLPEARMGLRGEVTGCQRSTENHWKNLTLSTMVLQWERQNLWLGDLLVLDKCKALLLVPSRKVARTSMV